MLECISNSGVWKRITDAFNIKEKKDKENALWVLMIVFILCLFFYFYARQIRKMIKDSCGTIDKNMSNFVDWTESGVQTTVSSATSRPFIRGGF
jgi:hypothetical protein